LEVIHVPGLIMILQGTDTLSRGIWLSPFQGLMDPAQITQAVFDPLTFDPVLVDYYVHQLPAMYQDRKWRYCNWTKPWQASAAFDRLTVWFPPPEIARQVMTFVLESWTERPLMTLGLFFIPRTAAAMCVTWSLPAFDRVTNTLSSFDSSPLPTHPAHTRYRLVFAISPAFSSHS
jgi:hypothetical protein